MLRVGSGDVLLPPRVELCLSVIGAVLKQYLLDGSLEIRITSGSPGSAYTVSWRHTCSDGLPTFHGLTTISLNALERSKAHNVPYTTMLNTPYTVPTTEWGHA